MPTSIQDNIQNIISYLINMDPYIAMRIMIYDIFLTTFIYSYNIIIAYNGSDCDKNKTTSMYVHCVSSVDGVPLGL